MDVLCLDGSPREIGRGLGRRAAVAVREAVFATAQFQGLRQWLGGDRLTALEAAARRHFPEAVAEIEGIAEGAGVGFAEIFLWNCRGDLAGLDRSSEDGCTTIMVPATDGRPATIAHNEDGAPAFADHGFLARVAPARGLGFTAFCYPGMLPGHAFAVNDAGLVQTINNIRPRDLAVGVPRHVISRAVLAADGIDAALALLRREDRASGFHHALGEAASGRLYSVEAPASGCVAVAVTAPMAHANHLIQPAFATLAQDVSPSSAARQRRADALLAEGGADDPLAILFDRADAELPILCRGERDGDDSHTLATALFHFGAGRIDWSVHHGPDRAPVYGDKPGLD